MKKFASFLIILMAMCLMTACGKSKEPAEVNIIDDAYLLKPSEKELLVHLFDACKGKAVKIVISPEDLTYEQEMDAKAEAGLTFRPLEWKYDVAITYFREQKHLFVEIQSARYQNLYDRKYAQPIYCLQAQTKQRKDFDNIALAAEQMAAMMQDSNWTRAFSPLYSVVDYLNESLIQPSHNLLHLFFFRIPLYIVLCILFCVRSVGWTIAIIMLLLFVWVWFYLTQPQHGLLLIICRWFHLLLLTTAICLIIPSYDMVTLIDEMGFSQVANILNTSFLNASSSGTGWGAAITFLLLNALYGGLILLATPKDKVSDLVSSQDTSDAVMKHIGFIILAFMMPGNIVWAINAYVFEKIILLFFRATFSGGALANRSSELATILGVAGLYILFIACWRIFLIDWTGWHDFTGPFRSYLGQDGFFPGLVLWTMIIVVGLGATACFFIGLIRFIDWWEELDKVSRNLMDLPRKNKEQSQEIYEKWTVNIWHLVIVLLHAIGFVLIAMLYIYMIR